MENLRNHIDDICLGDKFERNGIVYTVKSFNGASFVFVEGFADEDDMYTGRNEQLLNEINEYHLKTKKK